MIFADKVSLELTRQPLYRQVKQRILRSFENKKPGDRLSTEAEYVKAFGVSITTIRQAVRELEQEGWIERRQGSGTFLLDFSSRENTHVAILLDVDIASDNLHPYWLKVMREIKKALKAEGVSTRLYYGDLPLGTEATGLTCEDLLDDVRLDRVRGLVSFFTRRSSAWTDLLAKKSIPFVDPQSAWVQQLNLRHTEAFVRSALQYFQQNGCSLVASLVWEGGRADDHAYSETLLRLAPEYGIQVDSCLLDNTAGGWERGMGWERFRDIWHSGRQKPDALLIAEDALFADCQQAILEMGISVPEELKIVARSSDALELNPRFPIFNWKLLTTPVATLYARQIKALVEGRPEIVPQMPFFAEELLGGDISNAPSFPPVSPLSTP